MMHSLVAGPCTKPTKEPKPNVGVDGRKMIFGGGSSHGARHTLKKESTNEQLELAEGEGSRALSRGLRCRYVHGAGQILWVGRKETIPVIKRDKPPVQCSQTFWSIMAVGRPCHGLLTAERRRLVRFAQNSSSRKQCKGIP